MEADAVVDAPIELPDEDLPDEDLPDEDLPDEDLPDEDLPDEDLPDEDLPDEAEEGDGDVIEPTGGDVAAAIANIILGLLCVAAVALLALSAVVSNDGSGTTTRDKVQAAFFADLCIFIGLLAINLIGNVKSWGFFRPLIGDDGRLSTSLTQIGLWTVVIGAGLSYVLGLTIFDSKIDVDKALPGKIWDDYLILLGGPFAAAVMAKGIVTYKVAAGVLQKSEAAQPDIKQLAQNDNGDADLIDSQYLMFNVIAMAYFVVKVASDGELPTIPGVILSLTSGTAALYVANKAAARNAPTITSVSPVAISPGKRLTIFGTNFDPGDPTNLNRRITVSLSTHDEPIYSDDSSDTKIGIRIPRTVKPGWAKLVVTSTAGVETVPRDLKIRPKPRGVNRAAGQGGGADRPGSPGGPSRKYGKAPNRRGTKVTLQQPAPVALEDPGGKPPKKGVGD